MLPPWGKRRKVEELPTRYADTGNNEQSRRNTLQPKPKLRMAPAPAPTSRPPPPSGPTTRKTPKPPSCPPPPSMRKPAPTKIPDNPYLNADLLDDDYEVGEDEEEDLHEEEEPEKTDVEFDGDDNETFEYDKEFDVEDDTYHFDDAVDEEHELHRDEFQVSLEGVDIDTYPPVAEFRDLDGVPDYIFRGLESHNLYKPLPIQSHVLPIALDGHDIIGIAKTGSGKTMAFLIPAIVHIESKPRMRRDVATPIVLVLAPTRELAQQIKDEACKLLKLSADGNQGRGTERGIWVQEVYGGKQSQYQIDQSKGCAIIVATPGRLCDLVDRGAISLKRVSYFVLDEADRMLDFGFQDDVQNFAKQIPSDRQMLFFSATWPPSVQDLASSLCEGGHNPIIIRIGQQGEAPTTRNDIIQEVMVFDQDSWVERDTRKKKVLYAHLRKHLRDRSNKVLVFVSSKGLADELRDQLSKEGFATDSMHGGRGQMVRDHALEQFKTGAIRLLVATDVIGRGLDIPTITHVVIYDMGDIDDYVHRIGRTARGLTDRKGHALTLFEYDQKWSHLAGDLCQVLEDSEQLVPKDLQRIADEVESGKRVVVERSDNVSKKARKKLNKQSWAEQGENWNNGSGSVKSNNGWKPPTEKGVMCQNFASGACRYGNQCAFSHEIAV